MAIWALVPLVQRVARAIYLRLPDDARLWLRGREFIAPDNALIAVALSAPSTLKPAE